MSLSTSLSIASSGLQAVQYQLAVSSQNVSNASTPGYVTEIANVVSRDAGGAASGVVIQPTTIAINSALQGSLYTENAAVAGLGVTVNALSAVSAAQGSTTDATNSNTLTSMVGALQDAFTTLDNDPSSSVQQQTVVDSATTLAQGINSLSTTYQDQRQAAQAAIPATLGEINGALTTIGTLSGQIMGLQANGSDTADLQNQRLAAMTTLSASLGVVFTPTSTGDMLVSTSSGLALPTRPTGGPLQSAGAAPITASSAYGASTAASAADAIPPITLNGLDVTASLTGGTLGANLVLRDSTLPTMQGELDAFATTLASRFSASGLNLFTSAGGWSPDPNATADPTQAPATTAWDSSLVTVPQTIPLPANGELGFSAGIQVNPLVKSTPSLVRDGQDSAVTGAASFTANPATGPTGFSGLIDGILTSAFGTSGLAGTSQPASSTAGLGATGALSAPYSGTGNLSSLATTLTSSQAQTIGLATSQKSTATDMQTTLQAALTSSSSVSVDDEMSKIVALQNAYEANAKVVSSVQSMFSALLAAIVPG
ncbi:flagellar hook-associated protein FlgK [Lichenicoccus roseus]|uniref:Flagellar hook-associated protein 1 n=1 Tax=Lichenicoccus roseus TaxID=2683649 RepID=A0A5R9J0Y1_9PROT|nr:flagellar basal body rod C-terminal domain-containing protein [Lichenicoccus roseus]TLU70493.1 flagellar hook-associated protein FlgK [Lichenicoccus roseus]